MIRNSVNDRRSSRPQNVLLVSEFPLVRMGLAALLREEPDFRVCGECGTSEEAIAAVRDSTPDLIVVELSLKKKLSLELVRSLKAESETSRILVTSTHEDVLFAGLALQAGATGFVNKTVAPHEVLAGLRELAAGRIFLSPHVAQMMLGRAVGKDADGNLGPMNRLSAREFEIFEMIGTGWTTQRIARQLKLSVHTVETYRERLRAKLGIKNSCDLTFRAIVWVLLND